ncbi:TPA_asm: hypothetical protein [Hydra adintovirus]|nr:TPA_asm: hypothetical protein [Hydra adintovirus]
MLVINNKGYTHKYEVGGSGLFTPFINMFNRQALSNALNTSRILASRAAATDLGKTAVDAAKSAGKELATSAISTAKEIVINKGKKLIENVNKSSKLTPENKQELKNLINTLDNKLNEAVPDISKIMMGSSIKSKPVRIQDLVKKHKGDGLRII